KSRWKKQRTLRSRRETPRLEPTTSRSSCCRQYGTPLGDTFVASTKDAYRLAITLEHFEKQKWS
ncbi:hypothetical protein H633G_11615, partial [Metarhizium anisopliae BRIP 53284]